MSRSVQLVLLLGLFCLEAATASFLVRGNNLPDRESGPLKLMAYGTPSSSSPSSSSHSSSPSSSAASSASAAGGSSSSSAAYGPCKHNLTAPAIVEYVAPYSSAISCSYLVSGAGCLRIFNYSMPVYSNAALTIYDSSSTSSILWSSTISAASSSGPIDLCSTSGFFFITFQVSAGVNAWFSLEVYAPSSPLCAHCFPYSSSSSSPASGVGSSSSSSASPPAVNCSWTEWDCWTPCNVTCGGGIVDRTRFVLTPASNGGANCTGPSIQTLPCNNETCPVDCEASEWGEFGACSLTCGGGVMTRTRFITLNASNGGVPCLNLTDTIECPPNPCNGQGNQSSSSGSASGPGSSSSSSTTGPVACMNNVTAPVMIEYMPPYNNSVTCFYEVNHAGCLRIYNYSMEASVLTIYDSSCLCTSILWSTLTVSQTSNGPIDLCSTSGSFFITYEASAGVDSYFALDVFCPNSSVCASLCPANSSSSPSSAGQSSSGSSTGSASGPKSSSSSSWSSSSSSWSSSSASTAGQSQSGSSTGSATGPSSSSSVGQCNSNVTAPAIIQFAPPYANAVSCSFTVVDAGCLRIFNYSMVGSVLTIYDSASIGTILWSTLSSPQASNGPVDLCSTSGFFFITYQASAGVPGDFYLEVFCPSSGVCSSVCSNSTSSSSSSSSSPSTAGQSQSGSSTGSASGPKSSSSSWSSSSSSSWSSSSASTAGQSQSGSSTGSATGPSSSQCTSNVTAPAIIQFAPPYPNAVSCSFTVIDASCLRIFNYSMVGSVLTIYDGASIGTILWSTLSVAQASNASVDLCSTSGFFFITYQASAGVPGDFYLEVFCPSSSVCACSTNSTSSSSSSSSPSTAGQSQSGSATGSASGPSSSSSSWSSSMSSWSSSSSSASTAGQSQSGSSTGSASGPSSSSGQCTYNVTAPAIIQDAPPYPNAVSCSWTVSDAGCLRIFNYSMVGSVLTIYDSTGISTILWSTLTSPQASNGPTDLCSQSGSFFITYQASAGVTGEFEAEVFCPSSNVCACSTSSSTSSSSSPSAAGQSQSSGSASAGGPSTSSSYSSSSSP